jgi:hypothetical protein
VRAAEESSRGPWCRAVRDQSVLRCMETDRAAEGRSRSVYLVAGLPRELGDRHRARLVDPCVAAAVVRDRIRPEGLEGVQQHQRQGFPRE